MTNEVEEIRSSPIVPTVRIQLDIGGKLKDFTLRLSLLSVRNLEKEIAELGDEVDNILRTAIMIKHCLPRGHKMTNDDILDSLSFLALAEIGTQIQDLMTKGRGEDAASANPTEKVKRSRSRKNSGGNSKLPPASASTSASLNSGTPTPIN